MSNKRPSNILLIIPNLGRGGAQQVFRDQLQFYSEKYTTFGCVFNFNDSFADDRNLSIISLNIPAGTNWFSKLLCFWKRVLALRKIKQAHNIDFCISHLEGADYVNLISKRKEKIICWIHGSKVSDENIEGVLGTLRKKLLIPLTYRFSDKVVTVSEGIRQELINRFAVPLRKTATIYNSFDLDDIYSRSIQSVNSPIQELFNSKTTLITHCRLSRQKNLFALIDIYRRIKDQLNSKLIILGDGEVREELLKYCCANNLQAYSIWNPNLEISLDYDVYFLGYERNPYRYLHRATLYLMTSSWEGFPLSLCEAMACDIPVLSADCNTGPREIIYPGLNIRQPIQEALIAPYGILMPLASNGSAKIWSETIIELLKNTELRNELTKSAKQRVLSFDKKNIRGQWLKLVEHT